MIIRVRKSESLLAKAGVLGEVAGYSRAEAMGRLLDLWAQCKEEKTDTLAEKYVRVHLGPRGVEALLEAELGERSGECVRVRGAREEIEQDERRTNAARAAGKASGHARSGDGDVPEPNEPRTNEPRTSRQPNVNATSTERERKPNETGTAYVFSSSGISSDLSDSEASASSETSGDLKQKRRCAMPADFAPSPEHLAYAREHSVNVTLEVERCRDHYAGKGEPRKDWNATFRNWMRNEVKWRRPTPGLTGSAAARAVLEECEARDRARSS